MGIFRRRSQPQRRTDPSPDIALRAIGYVRNDVIRPRPSGWAKVESRIELRSEHAGKLAGIDRYSHVVVTFYMDLAADAPEKPETLTLASGNTYGMLATRSQLRPNHLGVSAVRLLRVEGATVTVRGLDAIDATPVLDIKPYLPEYDAHPAATIPEA